MFLHFAAALGFPSGSVVKNPPVMWVQPLGQDNPLEVEWQPTPVFLLGKSHGQRSLVAAVHGVTESQTRLSDWASYHWRCLSSSPVPAWYSAASYTENDLSVYCPGSFSSFSFMVLVQVTQFSFPGATWLCREVRTCWDHVLCTSLPRCVPSPSSLCMLTFFFSGFSTFEEHIFTNSAWKMVAVMLSAFMLSTEHSSLGQELRYNWIAICVTLHRFVCNWKLSAGGCSQVIIEFLIWSVNLG